MSKTREERIRERAYIIWEREGGPHGRNTDHWRQAEIEIENDERSVVPAASSSEEIARQSGATSAPVQSRPSAPAGAAAPSASAAAGKAPKRRAPVRNKPT
jgi:hypothetical protein